MTTTNKHAFDRLREMIRRNNVESALDEFCDIIRRYDSKAYDEAILHESRLQDIADNERRGLVTSSDAQTQRIRVRHSILELIGNVEQRLTEQDVFDKDDTELLEGSQSVQGPVPERNEVKDTTADSFDVFLSHNSADKSAVRRLGEALKRRNLSVWLDEWELAPGITWMDALEKIVTTCKSAAVCVGKNGIGPWEEPEMQALLIRFVKIKRAGEAMPVIPVLLPGAPGNVKLPVFLETFTWVDLRDGVKKEGLDRLQWGITGIKPVS